MDILAITAGEKQKANLLVNVNIKSELFLRKITWELKRDKA